ncbi:cytochrome b-c1 complex subunit 8 isoform X1 [Centropristis striata]|uniref:cytochrome b-c1 complex subunit 8 isoform X1 n=2 Tax=Centropristis striata TaxID=184440 RepID=UPI0027E0918C|nr:cytochrome b-c1 complex subunit 8 isoform X1 [Centropristis striata]
MACIRRKDTGTLLGKRLRNSTISSQVNMGGGHFGDLAKIRHVITYSLSPFEQRAFPNYFSKGIPNVWRRFTASFFKVAPPMALMYVTYTWGNSVHKQSKRKNPADFENDE